MSPYNGTPTFRIWPVPTKRILGAAYGEDPIVPNRLYKYLNFRTHIYADFTVCPFEVEKPGRMQTVCIESAENVVIEKFDDQGKRKLFRLR